MDFGLRALRLPTGIVVEVLGFLQPIRLSTRNFHSAVTTKIADGRLRLRMSYVVFQIVLVKDLFQSHLLDTF